MSIKRVELVGTSLLDAIDSVTEDLERAIAETDAFCFDYNYPHRAGRPLERERFTLATHFRSKYVCPLCFCDRWEILISFDDGSNDVGIYRNVAGFGFVSRDGKHWNETSQCWSYVYRCLACDTCFTANARTYGE